MKKFVSNPIAVFVLVLLIIAIPLCLIPINLFNGEIVYDTGFQSFVVEAPLSLSYFFGIGMNKGDLINVKTFYLTGSGYLTAFIFLIGIPGLIAYRIHLGAKKSYENNSAES